MIVEVSGTAPDPAWVSISAPGWTSVFLTWDIGGSVDAGVPKLVRRRIASALGSESRVVYLANAIGKQSATSWSQTSAGNWNLNLRATNQMVRGGSSRLVGLVCTREADVIAEMFDQIGFDWTLRGQLGLLFPPTDDCGDVDAHQVLSALSGDPPRHFPEGCMGVLRPGTDGDFAEVTGPQALCSKIEARLLV